MSEQGDATATKNIFADLAGLARTLLREWRWVAAGAAVPVVLGVYAASTASMSYTSTAKLLVLPSQDQTPKGLVSESAPEPSDLRAADIEMEILNNDRLKRAALDRVGVAEVYPGLAGSGEASLARAVRRFAGAFSTDRVTDTTIITASFRHGEPQTAQRVLKALVDRYIARRDEIYGDSSVKVLQEEKGRLQEQLDVVNRKMATFREKHGVSAPERQRELAVEDLARLKTKLADAKARVAEAEARVAKLRDQLAETPKTVEAFRETEGGARRTPRERLQTKLGELRMEKADMASRYEPDSRAMRMQRRTIAAHEDLLDVLPDSDTKTRTARNPVYEALRKGLSRARGDRAGATARLSALRSSIRAKQAEIDEYDAIIDRFDRIQLQRATIKDVYKRITVKLEEDRVVQNAVRGATPPVRVIEQAGRPLSGSSLAPAILAATVVFAAATGVGTGIIRGALRDNLNDPQAAETTLGLPVLAHVRIGRRSVGGA